MVYLFYNIYKLKNSILFKKIYNKVVIQNILKIILIYNKKTMLFMYLIIYKIIVVLNNQQSYIQEIDMTNKEPLTFEYNKVIQANFNGNTVYNILIKNIYVESRFYSDTCTTVHTVKLFGEYNS